MNWRKESLGVVVAVSPLLFAVWLFRDIEKHPTNDDWIAARTVKTLVEEHRWERAGYNGRLLPSALTPIAGGALLCSGEFSFGRLQQVTQLFVGVGVAAVFLLARAASASWLTSLVVAWTLLACPWLWSHAFTFMTDATAAGLTVAAAAAMAVGRFRDQSTWLWIGGVLLALAVATRQTALALVALPLIAFLVPHTHRSWSKFLICVGPAVLLLGVQEFGPFSAKTGKNISFIAERPNDGLTASLSQLMYTAYAGLLVVGFSLAPLAVLMVKTVFWSQRTKIVAAVSLLPALIFLLRGGRAVLTSATGPTLQNAHSGPILLSDCLDPGRWGEMGGVEWPLAVWFVATLVAFASSIILAAASENTLTEWWKDRSNGKLSVETGLWFSGVGAGLVLWLLMGFSFDRYWLAVFGPLVCWAAVRMGFVACSSTPVLEHVDRTSDRWHDKHVQAAARLEHATTTTGMCMILLLCFSAVNLLFTHDWLAFNQCRWSLVKSLADQGFKSEEIDGGYEVNGWHRSAEDPLTRPRAGGESSRWWSEKAVRCLAVGPRPGMIEVDRREWFSWAVRRPISILVLRRREGSASSPSPEQRPISSSLPSERR